MVNDHERSGSDQTNREAKRCDDSSLTEKMEPRDELLRLVLGMEPELDLIAATSNQWNVVDAETLTSVIQRELIRYGVTQDPALIVPLGKLYAAGRGRLSLEERMELLSETLKFNVDYPFAINALNPFIFAEDDFSIVASAALGLVCQFGSNDNDPMPGPKYVRALVDHVDDPVLQVGLYAGLLLTGDLQVSELVDRCWRFLPTEQQMLLTSLNTDFPSVLLVEFYLDWLEAIVEEDLDEEFGTVAAALARIPLDHDNILDIRRKYPAWKPDSAPAVAIQSRLTVRQLARKIEHRLRDLEELESEPKIMPEVLRYWGIKDA